MVLFVSERFMTTHYFVSNKCMNNVCRESLDAENYRVTSQTSINEKQQQWERWPNGASCSRGFVRFFVIGTCCCFWWSWVVAVEEKNGKKEEVKLFIV